MSRPSKPGNSAPAPGPQGAGCFFVSDLHGYRDRYEKLFGAIATERPQAVFLGGDLFPHFGLARATAEAHPAGFVEEFLAPGFESLRSALGAAFPRIFLILGNDDGRFEEDDVREAERQGLWVYAHGRSSAWAGWSVYGYSFIPPSPFRIKDWERYDVSRFVDPGCVSPEEGWRSVPVPEREARHATIQQDLEELAGAADMDRAIFLFHSPPYRTNLDRAGLDGRTVDHAPVDVNIGSIAIRRFIEARQPLLTLHGHVHESAELTGSWRDRIGRTHLLSAAHRGPELALVRFDPADPGAAARELI
jgi:Icc-related predicted phosphoesterase